MATQYTHHDADSARALAARGAAPERQARFARLKIFAPLHFDARRPQRFDRLLDTGHDFFGEWTMRARGDDVDVHRVAFDFHPTDHPQLHDVVVDFRVLDLLERREHRLFGRHSEIVTRR